MRGKNGPLRNQNTRFAIHRMFVGSADEDYAVARAAAKRSLHYQFAWSSQQAVEKLLKATMLMNGHPVTTVHSGLVANYNICLDFCDDLLPLVLCPPKQFARWKGFGSPFFEPAEAYLKRVETAGDPNNRYRTFSLNSSFLDLHKLDQLVFFLRRVAIPLDVELKMSKSSARMYLRENRLEQLTDLMVGKPRNQSFDLLEADLQWNNWSFFPEVAEENQDTVPSGAYINSESFMLFQSAELGALQWIAEHAFPKEIRKLTMAEIEKARS